MGVVLGSRLYGLFGKAADVGFTGFPMGLV